MFWIFETITSLLPFAPFGIVIAWAILAGVISMLVYGWVSPQEKLRQNQAQLQDSQKAMRDYDGDFEGMWQLTRTNLRLSLRRVWLSLAPSLAAGIPLLLIMAGLDTHLRGAHSLEKEATSVVQIDAATPASVNNPETNSPQISGEQQVEPSRVINADFLNFGPGWMRSWIFLFMVVSTVAALTVRQFGKIL